jgi:uncharacterized membrane protein (DUF106 family)
MRLEKINELLEELSKLNRSLKEVIHEAKDYELERLLKKVDAELMDAQHNLILAQKKILEKSQKD